MCKGKAHTNWPLKKLLDRHKLNNTELANLLKISPASVRNLIYGCNAPSFSVMYKLYVIFDLSPKEMMEIFFANDTDEEYLPHIDQALQDFHLQGEVYGKEKTYLLA